MAHANHPTHEISNPGTFATPSGLRTLLIAFVAIGIVCFVLGLMNDPQTAWVSYVHNHFYFMSLAVGGIFFASTQWVTNAMWSAPIRRVSESFTAYLPVALVTFLGLCFGLHHLYQWTHADQVATDIVLQHKQGYLNTPFFVIRNIVGILIWLFFAWKMVGNSILQDTNKGNHALTKRNTKLSPVFLILFALTFTVASFDQMMSLDPKWFSTIFGIYCFAGLFYSTLALTCLVVLYLKKQGKLDGIVNENHLHDLGKFMFAFTVFWAYIGFSQFMLIWYANLPEETGYFLRRMDHNWLYVSIFLLVGKFATPFFLLLPRHVKRQTFRLAFVGVWMMVAQWIDVMWMVQPEFNAAGPVVGPLYIGVSLGFLGLFGLAIFRFLARNNIVAIGDPRLAEAIHHHHQ